MSVSRRQSKVLSWKLSNIMGADFRVAALEEPLVKHGKPDIFNTGQGSRFTSFAFTNILRENGIRISMGGRGRWLDNVFIERLWRASRMNACIRTPVKPAPKPGRA